MVARLRVGNFSAAGAVGLAEPQAVVVGIE